MKSKIWTLVRFFSVETVGSIIWFPFWWYSKGVTQLVHYFFQTLSYRVKSYSFTIWIQNFFNPMYGQQDMTGRIVSVFMRFFVILFRFIALCVEAMLYGVATLLWLTLPFSFMVLLITNIVWNR